MPQTKQHLHLLTARLALLYVASYWGLTWIGYRFLKESHHLNAPQAGAWVSLAAALLWLVMGKNEIKLVLQQYKNKSYQWPLLFACALAATLSNYGFVWGVVNGEVMRAMLLFYLMPVWSVLLARLILKEKNNALGWSTVVIGFLGAMVMLYQPGSSTWLSLPKNSAEWAATAAGLGSALLNIGSQKIHGHEKWLLTLLNNVLGVMAGIIMAFLLWPTLSLNTPSLSFLQSFSIQSPLAWLVVIILGFGLALAYQLYFYGLQYLSTHQAVVIFPFELIVGAISSWLLVHEAISIQALIGGAMILSANVLSGLFGQSTPPKTTLHSPNQTENS